MLYLIKLWCSVKSSTTKSKNNIKIKYFFKGQNIFCSLIFYVTVLSKWYYSAEW